MLLKHSLSLTITNVQLVFKVLIYAFVVFFIGSAILVTIADPVLNLIGQNVNLAEFFNAFINDLLKGEGAVFESIINSVDNFATSNPTDLIKVIGLFVALIVAIKYFFAIIVCPVAYVLNHKMATHFTEGFFHAFVNVGFKGIATASLYTLICAPLDILIIVGAFFLGRWLTLGIGLFGMIIAIGVGIILLTLRLSIMGQWVAVFINENIKFSLQFKRGFRAGIKSIARLFPATLTLVLVEFGIVMTTLVPTFLIIPIVSVPFAIVCFTAIHLVNYYIDNERAYYHD